MNETVTLDISTGTRERFDVMKDRSHTVTDAALVWKALAAYEDHLERQWREAEAYRKKNQT